MILGIDVHYHPKVLHVTFPNLQVKDQLQF